MVCWNGRYSFATKMVALFVAGGSLPFAGLELLSFSRRKLRSADRRIDAFRVSIRASAGSFGQSCSTTRPSFFSTSDQRCSQMCGQTGLRMMDSTSSQRRTTSACRSPLRRSRYSSRALCMSNQHGRRASRYVIVLKPVCVSLARREISFAKTWSRKVSSPVRYSPASIFHLAREAGDLVREDLVQEGELPGAVLPGLDLPHHLHGPGLERREAQDGLVRGLAAEVRVLEPVAGVRAREARRVRAELVDGLLEREEVPLGLAHLLRVDHHVAV